MEINLALTNNALYSGCDIETVAGRLNLTTPMSDVVNIVGKNIAEIVGNCNDRRSITLTGAMAIPAYLVVFHAVVHSFGEVWYWDGRGEKVLIARHGKAS